MTCVRHNEPEINGLCRSCNLEKFILTGDTVYKDDLLRTVQSFDAGEKVQEDIAAMLNATVPRRSRRRVRAALLVAPVVLVIIGWLIYILAAH